MMFGAIEIEIRRCGFWCCQQSDSSNSCAVCVDTVSLLLPVILVNGAMNYIAYLNSYSSTIILVIQGNWIACLVLTRTKACVLWRCGGEVKAKIDEGESWMTECKSKLHAHSFSSSKLFFIGSSVRKCERYYTF
jgi:hypothetical protein